MGRNVVLSAGSTLLGVVAFAVGVVAVATPYWATFEDFIGGSETLPKYGNGSRVILVDECQTGLGNCCGQYTTAAGVCGVIAVMVTVLLCVTSPMVLAMRVTRRQVFVKFRTAVLAKLVISCLGVTSCVLSLILFGIDLDARKLGEETGYYVTRAWSFYLLVLFLGLCVTLCAFAAAEFVLARRLGGDPVKMARDPSGTLAPVISNPAARETRLASPTANGVTVIVAQQPRHVHLKKKRVEKRESSDESIDSGVIIIGNPTPGSPAPGRSKKVIVVLRTCQKRSSDARQRSMTDPRALGMTGGKIVSASR
ncbi:uncharacterized protein LOC119094356 [Pollicipes pollicipes]|uniref:uncharacterized protein LOC119094356 n=1 Tax=Pollicipes pollicipes TaxID=41117 RepID=UPI001884BBA8|nr:uncharacterized protein LOC119094356 [Pollicipes pollicipes]